MARKPSIPGLTTIHHRRYLMFKGNKTVEEIAAIERCSVETVQRSIAMVQGERAAASVPEMHTRQLQMLNSLTELEQTAMAEALQATVVVQTGEKDGKPIFESVPDHGTRLKAEGVLNEIKEIVTPKAKGGIGIFVGQPGSAPVAAAESKEINPAPTIGARSFEAILRGIKDRRQLALNTGKSEAGEVISIGAGEIVSAESELGDTTTARPISE